VDELATIGIHPPLPSELMSPPEAKRTRIDTQADMFSTPGQSNPVQDSSSSAGPSNRDSTSSMPKASSSTASLHLDQYEDTTDMTLYDDDMEELEQVDTGLEDDAESPELSDDGASAPINFDAAASELTLLHDVKRQREDIVSGYFEVEFKPYRVSTLMRL